MTQYQENCEQSRSRGNYLDRNYGAEKDPENENARN
jgi:hypothetical protein